MLFNHRTRILATMIGCITLLSGTLQSTNATILTPTTPPAAVVAANNPSNVCSPSGYQLSTRSGVQHLGTIGGESTTVAVSGTRAYLGEGSTVVILDVSQPANPVRIGSFVTPAYAQSIQISGTIAYVTAGIAGLTAFDVSDPVAVKQLGHYETRGKAYEVRIVGTYAYLTVTGWDQTGLHILDISDPTNLRLVGFQQIYRFAYDIAVENNIAYVTANYEDPKVKAINVSDPTKPYRTGGALYMQGQGSSIQVRGNRGYVASGESGFTILNIPTMREGVEDNDLDEIAVLDLPADFRTTSKDVFVDGNRAYVTRYDGYLNIIDITDENNPVIVGGFDTPNQSWEVQVSGGLVYLADGEGGLRIIDPSDPENPRELSHYRVSSPQNIKVAGDKLYIAGGDGGMEIVDISDLRHPRSLSR